MSLSDGAKNVGDARSSETRRLLKRSQELHPLDLTARLDWLYMQNGPAASDARWITRNGAPKRYPLSSPITTQEAQMSSMSTTMEAPPMRRVQSGRFEATISAASPYEMHTATTGRAKAAKAMNYLGPWCPDCGKRGNKCRNRKPCDSRRITRALRGLNSVRLAGAALPKPSEDWMVKNCYGQRSDRYYSGGRYKTSGLAKFSILNGVDHAAMRQHYAYDLAMGRV